MENRRGGEGLRRAPDYSGGKVSRIMGSRMPSSRCCVSSHRQTTTESWEETFCKVVGSMDWETLLEKKKTNCLYANVLKWNDLAGEEAFRDAKDRFFARISGLPCDLPVPDPDVYIDRVDWDAKVFPELLPDEFPAAGESHEPVLIFGEEFYRSNGFSLGGWDD